MSSDTPEMPEKIDVEPPRITRGDEMLGTWTVNQSTLDQTEYVRGDIADAFQTRIDELEAIIKEAPEGILQALSDSEMADPDHMHTLCVSVDTVLVTAHIELTQRMSELSTHKGGENAD